MIFVSVVTMVFVILASHPSVPTNADDEKIRKPLCDRSLANQLLHDDEIHRFDNDSLLHDNVVYPPELYWIDGNLTYVCTCELKNCVRKCCQNDEVLSAEIVPHCKNAEEFIPELSLAVHRLAEDIKNLTKVTDHFRLVNNRTCSKEYVTLKLVPEEYDDENFVLQSNGTLKLSAGTSYDRERYCMDLEEDLRTIRILVCYEPVPEPLDAENTIYPIAIVLSIPFLLATLLVYAIIPELKNLYGMTLMCYVASLVAAYCFLTVGRLVEYGQTLCAAIAFVIHFSFLASFFWLNVMCFDIWWTFGGFRSLQGSVRQRERNKFIIYSAYAWGSASFITGICLVMDFVPSVPKSIIKPEFGLNSCWFGTDAAKAIYFYGPMGVTVVCNICLFISTAMKIIKHKKDTAHHLKGMDSRRHDDNKQWFNLYLKLFIVMGINWSMEIISWLCKGSPQYVWYIPDLANTLQGVIIFVIFVWKEKIRRLLLKRLGCQNGAFQSRNSTRSGFHSSASRTCTTTAATAPLQDKSNPYSERTKTTTDESDCV